ncbi:MAG: hypothetical protein SGPRY_004918 [Prymnesium sp.]
MITTEPPLYLRQLLLAHQGTEFGDQLRAKFLHPALATQMGANLRDPQQLIGALTIVDALGGGMTDAQKHELKDKIKMGLPFFIQNELVPGVPNLRPWQRKFLAQAQEQWQSAHRHRLLGVYATGTGKSAAIAVASYAGSRDRTLVTVPNRLLLNSMREALGGPPEPGASVPDNPELPVLRRYGLIPADAPMPKVLVLPDLGKVRETYVYRASGYNPTDQHRTMIEIIQDHDIVLSTAQTLSREKISETLDANGQPVDEVDARLSQMNKWIINEKRPLFNLLIFDEAHHIKARTWGAIWNKLGAGIDRERMETIPQTNMLLVTATPYHDAGNLDVAAERDVGPTTNPPLSAYTLIDAHEALVVKGIVFLNINVHPEGQTQASWKLDVLQLVGSTLRSKMDAQPHIEHRALILVKDTAPAMELVAAYNALPNKPEARPGVPIVVESYFNSQGPQHPSNEEMESRLDRFRITSDPDPIHVLVQCAKLGEGYDQPNISVVGICSKIGKLSKFAQFSGRAVRKLGPGTVEQGLVNTVTDPRDNVAHIITHESFKQLQHWGPFTTQEGFGDFEPQREDDDDDEDINDAATTTSDGVSLVKLTYQYQLAAESNPCGGAGSSSATVVPPEKKLKPSNGARKVDRYALARDAGRQQAFLTAESGQHDSKPYMASSWEFINHLTLVGDH